jgi:tRNA(His) guanylyltransferase
MRDNKDSLTPSLGDRMKGHENVFRYYLPKKQYYVLRVDGKAFHTWTRDIENMSERLMLNFQYAALGLAQGMQGFLFAHGYSDEVSFVFTDLQDIKTELWFGGNIQKITSVGSSIFTAYFNYAKDSCYFTDMDLPFAFFDARVFSISSRHELLNYLLWRQRDASSNSVQSFTRIHASHKECQNLNTSELQELAFLKSGKNWNDVPVKHKRGWVMYNTSRRSSKIDENPPIFSQDWAWFDDKIPSYNNETKTV